jgi:hypothetical protein
LVEKYNVDLEIPQAAAVVLLIYKMLSKINFYL